MGGGVGAAGLPAGLHDAESLPRAYGWRGAVVVASTSAAAGTSEDRTGPVIATWLTDRGFAIESPHIVADGPPVGAAVRELIAAGTAVIIVTGGTGISPSDRTPEEVSPLLDVELPGIPEELRRAGLVKTPYALLTRCVAGFAGESFVVTLPGSPGGVSDGLAVLHPLLDHLLLQRRAARRHH